MGPETDPNFANVVALLHFDGADASTTFTDVTGRTWGAVGNAQLDTAQQKFGTASLLCDGTGDWISTADAAALEPGAGAFSLELWVRFNTIPGVGTYHPLISKWTGGANDCYDFYFYNPDGTTRLEFAASTNGSSSGIVVNENWAASTDTWYFVQFIRNGASSKFGVDGAQLGSDKDTSGTLFNGNSPVRIGGDNSRSLNGWIDDARITMGVARSITLPGAAFPDS